MFRRANNSQLCSGVRIIRGSVFWSVQVVVMFSVMFVRCMGWAMGNFGLVFFRVDWKCSGVVEKTLLCEAFAL